MEALLAFTSGVNAYQFPILMLLLKALLVLFILVSIMLFIYDRFIQREDQLLINFPLIGRLRYFFYLLRDPMRQYFGDEKFYESFDKVRWVYKAAAGKSPYTSFSPGQPQDATRLVIKNANTVLNADEVDKAFSVTFGEETRHPFTTRSVIARSAMSDGAISPEGTRAFAKGAYLGRFPINTGEGSLTSNFLFTHTYHPDEKRFLQTKEGTFFAKGIYYILKKLFNIAIAKKVYKHLVIDAKDEESYLFDRDSLVCYRIDWDAPLDAFPQEVPADIPDIIFQMGSGLYGIRDENGDFDEERYLKTMRFCRMTEIKIAQGAKQTGGKLLASKVTETIAYYRGVDPFKDLFSPNRFPYANTLEELFDFVGRIKQLSGKPVGIKIVISSKEAFDKYASLIKERIEQGSDAYPDTITIDGSDGGSGAAPLEMMMTVGMTITKALYIADSALREQGIRDKVRLIASEKVLTPDDAIILLGLGADMIAIARAFMMSAGCIRARECSGANGRDCPVGLATQNKRKRASFLVQRQALSVASYHDQMLRGIRELLAVMGLRDISELSKKHLMFKNRTGKTYFDVDAYFRESLET